MPVENFAVTTSRFTNRPPVVEQSTTAPQSRSTGRQAIRGFESCVLKRFTETTKWRDSWFRRLSIQAKALQIWLWDNCDNAGVIEIDLEAAAFDIGEPINEHHLAELESRLSRMDNGKVWLFKFIPFQYGSVLSEKCVPHLRISELLKSHGLSYPVSEISSSRVPPTLVSRVETTLRRGQGQEEDKDQDRKGVQGETKSSGLPATAEEAIEWASMEAVPADYAAAIFTQMESCGWIDGAQRRVTNFRAYVKSRFSRQKTVAGNGTLSGAHRVSAEKELDRIALEKKRIQESYDSHMDWNKEDRVRFRELKAREADLKKSLGAIA